MDTPEGFVGESTATRGAAGREAARPHRPAPAVAPLGQPGVRQGAGEEPLIEVLCVDGCPSHEQFLPHLERLLLNLGIHNAVHVVEVADDAEAQRLHFLGSPTLRINGQDVDPTATDRHDYALQCRLYPHAGNAGAPPDDWIASALTTPVLGTGPAPSR
jgi:hypothetical protein